MADKSHFDSPLPFWFADSIAAKFLSTTYGSIIRKRNLTFDKNPGSLYKATFPVISIGGIRAGGTGKTPSAMLAGELLTDLGREVVFLSRGYRRTTKENFIARPQETVFWYDTGDEPAMLHAALPQSWLGIGADRSANAARISKSVGENAVFVLDDGFQHRKIRRDLDIVCISESVFTDRLMPSGYLREPVDSLSRADVAFIIGSDETAPALIALENKLARQFPHLDCYILTPQAHGWVNVVSGEQTESPDIKNPLAICGIARPERFFSTLRTLGISPCRQIAFSDHHRFTKNDFCNFHELYSNGLVLTEKDAIRIAEFSSEISDKIWYLKIRLKFYSDDSLKRFNQKLRSILLIT